MLTGRIGRDGKCVCVRVCAQEMDWIREDMIDALWSHLGSWNGIWRYWERRFHSPWSMVLIVRLLSRRISQKVTLQSVWRSISRPYLCNFHREWSDRALLCEYAARQFVSGCMSEFAKDDEVSICFTGGFAAWLFHLDIETRNGGDAYPRCVKGSVAWCDTLRRNHLWVPENIDIFFCGDETKVLHTIRKHYVKFTYTLFHTLQCYHVLIDADIDETKWHGTLSDPSEGPALLMAAMADRVSTTSLMSGTLESVRANESRNTTCKSVFVRSWRLRSRCETFFPTQVQLTRTPRPVTDEAYPTYVTRLIDFVHCCVVLDVEMVDGTWRFSCDPEVEECVRLRRLKINAFNVDDCRMANALCRRIVKYHMNGFTFGGDPPY